jgi:predicted ribosome quality control (RQC) complex YloA/Tae2 family protein
MVTDHLLIRRIANELDLALRRRRVRDVGLTDRGTVAIVFGGKGAAPTLEIDPFGTPPLVWLSEGTEPALESEPGWLRAIGATLRGLTLEAVRSRVGDRVIALEFEGRSRFGVAERARLVLELVPRFGNLLLLRGETIAAAAKTFSPAENPERSVQIGGPYEPPPLPPGPPRPPRLIRPEQAADAEAAASDLKPVHVYRQDGRVVAAHLVPLAQYADLEHTTAPQLLAVWAESASRTDAGRRRGGADRRRLSLVRALGRRRDAIAEQLEQLAARERELGERDKLRAAGERIYARLSRMKPKEQADAKAEAARYFERYKKAGAALPRLQQRRAALERERSELETLLWEVERADADALDEIARDFTGKSDAQTPRRKSVRKPLCIELSSGSRIYVGRSPRENAEITFGLARPNDLWFHARNTPGAHVVLTQDDRTSPSDDDIAHAAAIAAFNSRARESARVDVDYTRRKYVRKQKGAAPGMVWYTDFKTIRVTPRPV